MTMPVRRSVIAKSYHSGAKMHSYSIAARATKIKTPRLQSRGVSI